MKAIEYARDGMFVPEVLTKIILNKMNVCKKQSILVMFSYEMLQVLNELGYTNVTLGFDNPRTSIYNIAKYFGYKVKTLEEINNMKFNVVLGNPPYQNPKAGNKNTNQGGGKKLYVQFMKLASDLVEDDGLIAFITPSAVFKTTTYGKLGKGFSSMGNFNLLFAETNVSKYFNVGVSIGWWIGKKTKQKFKTIINGIETNFNRIGFYANDVRLQPIAEKLLTNKKPLNIQRDRPLLNKGIITSRYAYLVSGAPEDACLAWEYDEPEKLKRLLSSNMFCRVAWDGFVVLDKRWYHNFWSALYVHPKLTVDMNDDEIMNIYGLTKNEKKVINEIDRRNVVKIDVE